MYDGMCSRCLGVGMKLLHLANGNKRFHIGFYQWQAIFLTFLVYMSYHASRRPLSIVKPKLAPESPDDGPGWLPFNVTGTGTDDDSGKSKLGYLDTAFLVSYTFGVLASGHIGDRTDLRCFLLFGMVGSGAMVTLAGMAYFWRITSYWYFILSQVLIGLFEGTGWPVVVSVVAQWFGKGRRGFIMGLWNSHTSVGNMLGSVLASAALVYGWGYSYVVLGVFMGVMGIFVWMFLVVSPSEVGYTLDQDARAKPSSGSETGDEEAIRAAFIESSESNESAKEGINFFRAWAIPGVIQFSVGLFGVKLVAYTFLFWLPYYLKGSFQDIDPSTAGDLSTLFDIGGILGGITAGLLSDVTGANATVATAFTLSSVPMLWAYRRLGRLSLGVNAILLVGAGFFVNGPYALITTAVSADLGTHKSIEGNKRALSTVTAIIDAMGSLGAALGPTLTGQILAADPTDQDASFNRTFLMLEGSAALAGVVLLTMVGKEIMAPRPRESLLSEERENEGGEDGAMQDYCAPPYSS